MVHERATGPRFVVVAGTGTGVGKTWVGCALAHALRAAGRDAVALKPVETGCSPGGSGAEDGAQLARATGQLSPTVALSRFELPVAPAVAAEREGRTLDWDALVASVAHCGSGHEIVLVEGAGGLLSPLTWTRTLADLARALGATVVLVGRDALGVLHDVSACVAVARSADLAVAHVVLTAPEVADASTGTNALALARLLPALPTFVAPREPDPARAASAFAPLARIL